MSAMPVITATKKTGHENFKATDRPLPMDLKSFWQWPSSELAGNVLRGVLAEYIVALAVRSIDSTRTEWDAIDIETPAGTKIEVKPSAYIQSWTQ